MKLLNLLSKYRNSILIIVDIIIVVLSYVTSVIFLKTNISSYMNLAKEICIAILVYITFLSIMQMYKNMIRYEIKKDYIKYIVVCLISTITMVILTLLLGLDDIGLRSNILSGILISILLISYRAIGKSILTKRTEHIYKTKYKNIISENMPQNLLIIGAGNSTRELIIAIKKTMKEKYNIIGIIDDNTNKLNHRIMGIQVIGTRYDIPDIVKEKNVNVIFLTINRITPLSRKKIIEICQSTGVKTRVLPTPDEFIEKNGIINNLRDVEIEDLLGRDPIQLDNKNINILIKDKVVLVTGGGGSIGSELCRQIIKYNPKELIILDIYENNLYDIEIELKTKFPKAKISAIVASVRDDKHINEIFEKFKPQLVFHAAAHKHVPLMENNPLEAIKNNIFGTLNVVNSADKYETEKFVLISTDKAVNPTNIMGASKRVCEMIVQSKNKESKTEYVAVRFGNVLGSNGSVVPLFKRQIEQGGPVTVTHKDITRFFMTIPEAVGLILQSVTYANGGEIFVLDMGEPVKIYDLALNLIKLSGYEPNKDIHIEFTGLRPGEKLYEELLMKEEGLTSTKHNKIFISKPMYIEMNILEKKLDLLRKLEYNDKYSKDKIKETMKLVVSTYKEPNEVNKIL